MNYLLKIYHLKYLYHSRQNENRAWVLLCKILNGMCKRMKSTWNLDWEIIKHKVDTSKWVEVEKQTVRTKGRENPNDRNPEVGFRNNK